MNTPAPDAKPEQTGPLKRLKDWSEWLRFVLGLAAALCAVATLFVGGDQARLLGWLAAALVLAVCVLISVVLKVTAATRTAESLLTAGTRANAESRRGVATDLKKSRRATLFITGVLAVVAGVSLVFLFWRPIYHRLYTDFPDKVRFATIDYFDPTRDQAELRNSQFLKAVVTALKDEASAEGRKTRILLGETTELAHPTPAFKAVLSTAGHPYEITGYAFRRFQRDDRMLYEALTVGYQQTGCITLEIPASENGDAFFFVGRISLLKSDIDFPSDLHELFEMTVVKPEA